MNYAEQLRSPWSGHRTGLIVVVALHVGLGWALLHMLQKRSVDIPPPLIDVAPLPIEDTPPPPVDPLLPTPKLPTLPHFQVPVPESPTIQRDEPAITGTKDAVPYIDEPWKREQPTTTVPDGPATPRAVAKPAIANVQACAPGADDYPAAARRVEATGTTRLRFTIDATGALTRSEIIKSAGMSREHRLLDNVAASKLGGCYFTAGIDENGRPMGGTFEVDYIWKLQ